jgi:hypothetical protein
LNSAQSAKGISDARDYYVAVRRLQEPQLHNDEEQEEAYRTAGNEEVLQYVPEANGTQGSEVSFRFRESVFAGARDRPVLNLGESSNG